MLYFYVLPIFMCNVLPIYFLAIGQSIVMQLYLVQYYATVYSLSSNIYATVLHYMQKWKLYQFIVMLKIC